MLEADLSSGRLRRGTIASQRFEWHVLRCTGQCHCQSDRSVESKAELEKDVVDRRMFSLDSHAGESSECSRQTIISGNDLHRKKGGCAWPLECKKIDFVRYSPIKNDPFHHPQSVLPTAQRAAIVSGVELAVYDWMKKQLIYRFHRSDTIGTHFVSSFTAGLAGALASTPIDVVRVRLFFVRDGNPPVMHCVSSI